MLELIALWRSIPARTGEPDPLAISDHGCRVYPRAYGGTYSDTRPTFSFQGLSPRVRGNPTRTPIPTVSSGSIPARTGEPATFCRAQYGGQVYPRAYGGTADRSTAGIEAEGLSPRVRGNHAQGPNHPDNTGLSPRVRGNPQFGHSVSAS